jgi:chromosome partitioning protein
VRIAVIAGKGGVGKTTSVINLGASLAAMGQRCLVVDCDPQSNLTSGLGLDPYAPRLTLSDVIVGRCAAGEAVVETATPGLHLLPAHPDLSAVEVELPTQIGSVVRLRDALDRLVDGAYDVVLFDTPPNFGFHTISALASARYALVPLQMSAFALRGVKEVVRIVSISRRGLNPELRLLGLAPTFVNHTRFSRDMMAAIGDLSNVRVFHNEIATTVRLQESAMEGVPVLVSAPGSRAAQSYAGLAAEIAEATELTVPAWSAPLSLADLEAAAIAAEMEEVAATMPEAVHAVAAHGEPTAAAVTTGDASDPDDAPAPQDGDSDWLTLIQSVREQPAAARPRGFRHRLFRRERAAAS